MDKTALRRRRNQTGADLNNLGVALRLASRPAEAGEAFNRALEIAEESGDTRLLATALGGLGATLVDQGEFARAQHGSAPAAWRVVRKNRGAGFHRSRRGEAANNLAMVYRKSGDLAQAQAQLERALPLMEKFLDPGNPALALAFNNMFIVLVGGAERRRAGSGGTSPSPTCSARLKSRRGFRKAFCCGGDRGEHGAAQSPPRTI